MNQVQKCIFIMLLTATVTALIVYTFPVLLLNSVQKLQSKSSWDTLILLEYTKYNRFYGNYFLTFSESVYLDVKLFQGFTFILFENKLKDDHEFLHQHLEVTR